MRDPRRGFWIAAAITTLAKVFLAWRVPIIGDEAYYAQWGLTPALGYFDHGPVTGWLYSLIFLFGNHPVLLRLPAILLSVGLAWILIQFMKARLGEERAYLGGILVLLVPLHAFGFFIGVDLTLIFFTYLSVFSYSRALEKKSFVWAIAAGISLGLAFLSKYFAVFVGIAFVAHALFWWRDRFVWKALAVLVFASVPWVALHFYWNYTHCWATVYFHFHGRDAGQGYHPKNVQAFGMHQLYMLGPAMIYALIAYWKSFRAAFRDQSIGSLLLFSYAVPILIFFATSFRLSQGLHWTLAFYPFLFAVTAFAVSAAELRVVNRVMAMYAGIHLIAVIVLISFPLERWKGKRFYSGLAFSFDAPAIAAEVVSLAPDTVTLASDGYSEATVLEISSRRRFSVFGQGILFGRQDDLLTDFTKLDGKDIWIVTRHERPVEEYAPFFERLSRKTRSSKNSTYFLYRGERFKYATYLEQVLTHVREMHYRIPKALPMRACYFNDRYFPEQDENP